MNRYVAFLMVAFLMSSGVEASETKYFIAEVQAEGDLALKAAELDKLVCLAGAEVAKKKKENVLCAHEVKAMMQHFAMTQNLGINTSRTVQGPDYYFQNAEVVFRTFVETVTTKNGSLVPTLRIQYLKGGNPPFLVKETRIAISKLPKDHELVFIEDIMLSLLQGTSKKKTR